MTRNSLCELHTLDRHRHVSPLPENRLRRRHVLKYATQLTCIRWSTLRWSSPQLLITPLPRFPRSIVTFIGDSFSFMPITLLQHSHCTFVTIFVGLLFGCSLTWRRAVSGVRIVQCHATIDVVIGVRVMLWHQTRQFWIFHFSEFSTSCPNSHLVVML